MRLGRPAVQVDDRVYSIGEVLAGAWLAGLLDKALARLESQMACRALALAEAVALSGDVVQESLDRWRLQHDLASAMEFRRMLQDNGLVLRDSVEFCRRELAAILCRSRADEASSRFPAPRSDALRLLPVHAFFSLDISGLAGTFARRWLVPDVQSAPPLSARAAALLDPQQGAVLRESFGVDESTAVSLVSREHAWATAESSILSACAQQQVFDELRPELTRLDLIVATTGSLPTASEVARRARQDGCPLESVCASMGIGTERRQFMLHEVPASLFGCQIDAAPVGEVVGPCVENALALVGQVIGRSEPQLDQPEVVAVVRETLLQRRLGAEERARARVTWRLTDG